MQPAADDTIVALATARGVAALALVRLSGQDALKIADVCFRGIKISGVASHSLVVGIFSTAQKEEIDQVVVAVFRAPNSVTGEDIVEISCHGGDFAANRIIESLIEAGARPAQPGEFTKRGFVNGRMNLSQAEAVANIIDASSRRAHKSSLAQLKGGYSVELETIRSEMLDLCSAIELELDFSEEDIEFASPDRLTQLFSKSVTLLSGLIDSYRFGVLIRDGILVVIGGRPNAGKSTLLNALVGYNRAIVSEFPGTTRDEIDAEIEYDGLRIRFRDTAGLRITEDIIEAEGVKRAEDSIRRADALFYVYDASVEMDEDEHLFLERIHSERPDLVIHLLANKSDLLDEIHHTENSSAARRAGRAGLPQPASEQPGSVQPASPQPGSVKPTWISALAAQSDEAIVKSLLQQMVDDLRGSEITDEAAPVVTSQRHRDHLLRALAAVKKASEAWESSASGDILSLELRAAMYELGSITGATTNEDVLGHIFSKFCIGK